MRATLKELMEADSEQQMAECLGLKVVRADAGGQSQRVLETRLRHAVGVIRLRVRRTRKRSFLPRGLRVLDRRSPEVAELIRQAFVRDISTRGVGRMVELLTDEPVSAQTVSKLTRVPTTKWRRSNMRR